MKVSFIHIYLMQKLIESCCEHSDIVQRSKISEKIILVRIPLKHESKVIKELEDLGFVEIIDKYNIRIKKEQYDKYVGGYF